jgi:hypothetical protein
MPKERAKVNIVAVKQRKNNDNSDIRNYHQSKDNDVTRNQSTMTITTTTTT